MSTTATAAARGQLPDPSTDDGVDELLSRPTQGAIASLKKLQGPFSVLGVGGKMGPTLARMIRRGLDEIGRKDAIYGVARFSDKNVAAKLEGIGVTPVSCDLLDTAAVAKLPESPSVLFLAGQKFGTTGAPDLTWAMNTLVPAHVCERYTKSRIVAFSTGCVYPLASVDQGGSKETDPIGPMGDYPNSCVGRERIFTFYSKRNGTPVAIYRLNYAIDLRYGVLLDLAERLQADEPIDITMGHANIIWQGDANAAAISCLEHAASPPFILNVTGPTVYELRDLAERMGRQLGRTPKFTGKEAPTSWIANAGKYRQLMGEPSVGLDEMIRLVANWVKRGGATLGKPTHFETRDGNF
jgi:nucleoside-diphosphate-sugar epimerase